MLPGFEQSTVAPAKKGRKVPQSNRKGDQNVALDLDFCLTPPYAIDPLLPYLINRGRIWEPACGENFLVRAMMQGGCTDVLGTDLRTGTNFFSWQPDKWDLLVTNPPYSNPTKFKFIGRCYELLRPFALLIPLAALGTASVQGLMEQYGGEIMLLDSRVDFKMPNAGWNGRGAQFPVVWLTCGLLPHPVMYGKIARLKQQFKKVEYLHW